MPARLISLFVEKSSLQRVLKFPVLLRREFVCKPLNLAGDSGRLPRSEGLDSAKFPVYFPVKQGILVGDRSDADCLVNQILSQKFRDLEFARRRFGAVFMLRHIAEIF